jgi:hypothetical protein
MVSLQTSSTTCKVLINIDFFSDWIIFLPSNLPTAAGNELVFELKVVTVFPAGAGANFDGLAESAVFYAVINVGFAETSIGHDELQINECILAQFHRSLRMLVYDNKFG